MHKCTLLFDTDMAGTRTTFSTLRRLSRHSLGSTSQRLSIHSLHSSLSLDHLPTENWQCEAPTNI